MKKLFVKLGRFCRRGFYSVTRRIYTFFAVRKDRRYGGLSANHKIPSKYREQGAHATQSSDYRCLKRVFRNIPLRKDEVFADVGCGEGRVLTWLHSRGYRFPAYGIELDENAAKTAAQRTAACENVSIVCGNVLEQGELFRSVTAIYLFNPFYRSVFCAFLDLLEEVCEQPVRLYYLNAVYADELNARKRWSCLESGEVRRVGNRPMPFAVYQLKRIE